MESVSGLNNREVERNANLASGRSSCLEQFPGVQVSADVTDHRCTELGGKLIGQPTIVRRCAPCRRSRAHSARAHCRSRCPTTVVSQILRRKYKLDPYDDSSLPLGGSGDKSKRGWTSRAWHATKRVLVSPVRFYIEAAYLSRPSITSKEARANEWAALHSPHRYILSILVGFGPPGYVRFDSAPTRGCHGSLTRAPRFARSPVLLECPISIGNHNLTHCGELHLRDISRSVPCLA